MLLAIKVNGLKHQIPCFSKGLTIRLLRALIAMSHDREIGMKSINDSINSCH